MKAGLWTIHALYVTVRRLRTRPIEQLRVPRAPSLGLDATRGVDVVLRLTRATCLQASVVRQRWYAEQGVVRDVVIGVTSPRTSFKAHAWLEGPGETSDSEYTVITRLPASATAAGR